MTCPSCGAEAAAGARFCDRCGTALTVTCPSCGAEAAPGARFCSSCGATLTAPAGPPPPSSVEERKVVTVLFADLVGFTAHTEQSDPEDVRARLTVYHRRIREDVQRYGGRVEKLMGDGVFAVFGAPAAHEDDPERAVRSALRIQESVTALNGEQPGLGLAVRVAVTTGEAIVQLDRSDPDREGIIGDVVNTASRLQAVAPPGGVVVDERTYGATRHAIELTPLDPVTVKGKLEPIPIWQAEASRSRYGVAVEEEDTTPFLGRERELALLVDAFDRTLADRSAQLVTIIGEPGVGKSRLVREFRSALDDRPEIIWWRQGRCLPLGEGGAFWALGDVVKAQAGILDSEPLAAAVDKLRISVAGMVDDARQQEWLVSRLSPLAGTGVAEGAEERGELFAAWLRFLEAVAARNPLVLVIEDIHWADGALLDFLTHVLEWSVDASIMLVTTARPELHANHPTWGAGTRNSVTVGLSPLSDRETAALLGALLPRALMSAEVQRRLLDRCGGNPLYATEFARLASELGAAKHLDARLDELVPGSVQALIAARLDLLDQAEKSTLQAASVIGKVFWSGAVGALRSLDQASTGELLRRLARRELIRPVRRPSMEGQDEYAFQHGLIRDVAYGQIPRSERSRLHREAGRWIEEVSGERLGDAADLLVHHYSTSLELGPVDAELGSRVYRMSLLAGERATVMDLPRAVSLFRRAAEMAGSPEERARALLETGRVAESFEEAEEAAREALELFREAGSREGVVEATVLLGRTAWYQGRGDDADVLDDEAVTLTEGLPPSPAVAAAVNNKASRMYLRGRAEEALELGEQALGIAQAIGSTEEYVKALMSLGSGRTLLGDESGVGHYEEALRIARDRGFTRAASVAYNNLATWYSNLGDFHEGLPLIDEAIEFLGERGYEAAVDWSRNTRNEFLMPLGRLDEILAVTGELLESDRARGAGLISFFSKSWQATVLFFQGREGEARRLFTEVLESARQSKDPQGLAPALANGVDILQATGDPAGAAELADEFEEATAETPIFRGNTVGVMGRALAEMGRLDQLERLIEGTLVVGGLSRMRTEMARAYLAEGRGRLAEAAERFQHAGDVGRELGHVFDPTIADIGAARCLLAGGHTEEASPFLDRARASAGEMGAGRLLRLLEELEAGGEPRGATAPGTSP